MTTPIEKSCNLGLVTAEELKSVGIGTLEELVSVGWETAFERWVMAFPERVNVNAACALRCC